MSILQIKIKLEFPEKRTCLPLGYKNKFDEKAFYTILFSF